MKKEILREKGNEFCILAVELRKDDTVLSITGEEGHILTEAQAKRQHDLCDADWKNGKVYVTESCGQIREALVLWFPEYAKYFGYHLNDMHAGTPTQEAFLAEHKAEYPGYPTSYYDWATELLAANKLNPDPTAGYKYGSAWLSEPLPEEVVRWAKEIK